MIKGFRKGADEGEYTVYKESWKKKEIRIGDNELK